jgi:hypothetical protein
MKGIQNKKGLDLQKPIPGCMGRMVNLFDLSNSLTGTKRLTEKPHRDGINFTSIFFLLLISKLYIKKKDASDMYITVLPCQTFHLVEAFLMMLVYQLTN